MNNKHTFMSICLLALLSLSAPAFAAAFIKFDGVDGESSLAPVRDEPIEVLSFSWGVAASAAQGGGRPAAGSNEFLVAKELDKSTPLLMQAVTRGETVREITFTETYARGDSVNVTLQNVRLLSVEIVEGREILSLGYGSIEITYTPQRGAGEATRFRSDSSLQATPARVRAR